MLHLDPERLAALAEDQPTHEEAAHLAACAACAREQAAYEELVRRYQDVALRTAYLVCPETDADDAVQEAFLKAYAALYRASEEAGYVTGHTLHVNVGMAII